MKFLGQNIFFSLNLVNQKWSSFLAFLNSCIARSNQATLGVKISYWNQPTKSMAVLGGRGDWVFYELWGTDYVRGQISEHIFDVKWAYCIYYPSNIFCNIWSFENWGISSDIPQFWWIISASISSATIKIRFLFSNCKLLKKSAVKCWSISSIDTLDQHSINTQLILNQHPNDDQHSLDISVDSRFLQSMHMSWSMLNQLSTGCWSSVNQVSTEYQLNGLVQEGCKWLFQVKFFSFKSAWIFACAF